MGEAKTGRKKRRKLKLFLDLTLFAGCCGLAWLILGAAMERASVNSDVRIVKREAYKLYEAFEAYRARNQGYPGDFAGRVFDPATLDPLRKRGYYEGFIQTRLLDQRVDAYGSPDDRGKNQEFWIEMSLARDPRIRFLVAKTDDAPLGAGHWCDGVFIFRGGELSKL